MKTFIYLVLLMALLISIATSCTSRSGERQRYVTMQRDIEDQKREESPRLIHTTPGGEEILTRYDGENNIVIIFTMNPHGEITNLTAVRWTR